MRVFPLPSLIDYQKLRVCKCGLPGTCLTTLYLVPDFTAFIPSVPFGIHTSEPRHPFKPQVASSRPNLGGNRGTGPLHFPLSATCLQPTGPKKLDIGEA